MSAEQDAWSNGAICEECHAEVDIAELHAALESARAKVTELRAAIREHAVKAYVDGPDGVFRSGTCDWCHYAWAGAVEVHRLPDCLAALDAPQAEK